MQLLMLRTDVTSTALLTVSQSNKQSIITTKNCNNTVYKTNYKLITDLLVLTSVYSQLTNDSCLIEVDCPLCISLVLGLTAGGSTVINSKLR